MCAEENRKDWGSGQDWGSGRGRGQWRREPSRGAESPQQANRKIKGMVIHTGGAPQPDAEGCANQIGAGLGGSEQTHPAGQLRSDRSLLKSKPKAPTTSTPMTHQHLVTKCE